MQTDKYINIEKILIFISLFTFIFLWDLKFNLYIQARFLIILPLIYYFFFNYNLLKKNFIIISIIFFLISIHIILNLSFEFYNINFNLIKNFNYEIINFYEKNNRIIYILNTNYFLHFLPIIGMVICFLLASLIFKFVQGYYFYLSIGFIMLFFVFDFLINLYHIVPTSKFQLSSLCMSYFKFDFKIFQIFKENSHYGMIIPSVILIFLYKLSEIKKKLIFIFVPILFIPLYFNLSATLILGMILSSIIIIIFNYRRLSNLFIFTVLITIIILLILNYSNKSCSSRTEIVLKIFNPSNYNFDKSVEISDIIIDSKTVSNIDDNINSTTDLNLIESKISNNSILINNNTEQMKNIFYKKYSNVNSNFLIFSQISKYKENNITNINFFLKRFIDLGITNLTIEVLINSLNLSIHSLIDRPLGWGINRFYNAFTFYQPRIPVIYNEVRTLNYNDGASNISKMLVELGIFALIPFYFYFFFTISRKISLEDKLFLLPIIITQMVRGAGYFNGGFMLVTLLIIFKLVQSWKKI